MQQAEAARPSIEALSAALGTTPDGLGEKEAAARLASSGANVFRRRGPGAAAIFGRQFKNSLIYLLIAASALAYAIRDARDGTVILIILAINTSLGFFQEFKSEKTVEKLSRFISTQVRVKRGGSITLVDESRIVPGDILVIREGDIVPADLRLIDAVDLTVDESQLTGESTAVAKQPAPGAGAPAAAFLFAGSVALRGEGTGIVYATGNDSQLGSIARLSTDTKKTTQYEQSLRSFSSLLMRVVLSGLALVFAAKFMLAGGATRISDLLLFVIALAVGTVPEALPVIATVTLSAGALKLARRHVVVRRLSAMEDFGNINLLCTDKTGTITENKMAVRSITAEDPRRFEVFAYASVTPLKTKKRRSPNAYDDAFLQHATKDIAAEAGHFAIVKEIPFDPEDRRSRIILKDSRSGDHYLLSIGAPESLFAVSEHGKKPEYRAALEKEGSEGLHHLAIAAKKIEYHDGFDLLKNEHGLAFLGFASLEDPLRPSAKTAIERARKLGISIKILTGDSREVAAYAGREIGLLNSGDRVPTGDELGAMTETEFRTVVRRSTVFARVSPTQKFAILKTLKETNVVGYQGDGINDAPALKLADVAIAVNSATDIAKANADIILLSRSLEVVIDGITAGRAIFVNINKYIRYTMSNNFGTFVGLSALYLVSATLPILPAQMLLNNLLGDIPLLAVSADSVEDAEVVQPQKHNMRELMLISLILGIPTALFGIFYFALIQAEPLILRQTLLYIFFTFQALIVFYAIRNKRHFWQAKQPPRILNAAFIFAFAAAIAVVYLQPFQVWFSFAPAPASTIVEIAVLMGAYLIITDYLKTWYYRSMGA